MKSGIMASGSIKQLRGDTEGAAFLEFTVFAGVFFSLLFGIVEFTLAYYQWNAATKAVQLGARLAAVSDPMTSQISQASWDVTGYLPGDVVDIDDGFDPIVCTGAEGGNCNAPGDYNADAMNTLLYGRGNTSCKEDPRNIGMCDLFWRIEPENVVVTYSYTGMGYAGRPGGPVPTIRVDLVNIPFQFFFISALLGSGDINIPRVASTMSGEDLSLSGS
jgi:hypothetical protein